LKKITIAIDGFSSTGKSTLAKQLAQQLGYVYVDTGAMYRAVTWYAMQHHFVSTSHLDVSGLISNLDQITLHFVFNPALGFGEMFLAHVIPAFFNNDQDHLLSRAQLTAQGKLTPRFAYLQEYVEGN
jgi:broad-specificity NMP kinase